MFGVAVVRYGADVRDGNVRGSPEADVRRGEMSYIQRHCRPLSQPVRSAVHQLAWLGAAAGAGRRRCRSKMVTNLIHGGDWAMRPAGRVVDRTVSVDAWCILTAPGDSSQICTPPHGTFTPSQICTPLHGTFTPRQRPASSSSDQLEPAELSCIGKGRHL